MQQQTQPKRRSLLTDKDVMDFLGITKTKLRDLHERQDGPPYYWISATTKCYDPDDFDAWLQSRYCPHHTARYALMEKRKTRQRGDHLK